MWKLHVMLIIIRVICTRSRLFVYCMTACLSGSYMVCMLFMASNALISMKYLNSMSCRRRLPLYMVSSTRYPREFLLHPMALTMSCVLCFSRLCFGSSLVGIIVGCCVVVLSFCIPSWVDSRTCKVWSSCGVFTSICMCVLKFFMIFLPTCKYYTT